MSVLLIAEHDNSSLSGQTAKALSAAARIGGPVDVLVAGLGAKAAAEAAARLGGVGKVLLAESEALAHGLAEPLAAQILALAPGYEALVAPATANGKAVMPRVAALLDVMQISEIVEVLAPDRFKRPVYAGNAIQTVRSNEATRVVTVRTAAFEAAPEGGEAPIETVAAVPDPGLSKFIGMAPSPGGRPELTAARVVVSGGRAMGSAEAFEKVLMPVADKLGAAVGATRAAVDAGFAPNDWQVGQTGKVVAPELYIACGISGAIQHLAGIKDARVIVAVNSDAEAPIFEVADYYLVADLFEALPELARAL